MLIKIVNVKVYKNSDLFIFKLYSSSIIKLFASLYPLTNALVHTYIYNVCLDACVYLSVSLIFSRVYFHDYSSGELSHQEMFSLQ